MASATPAPAAAPALAITDLRKVYDTGVQALKGVSLQVEPGDFFALLGPNGAGKSTLIGVVSSLVNKSSGQVGVFGVDIDRDRDGAMRLLGLVPQEINFNMFEKPLDICVNYAGFYGIPRAEALVRAALTGGGIALTNLAYDILALGGDDKIFAGKYDMYAEPGAGNGRCEARTDRRRPDRGRDEQDEADQRDIAER